MNTVYILRREGSILEIGDDVVHYLGAPYDDSENFDKAKMFKTLSAAKQTTAYKYDRYFPVEATVVIRLKEDLE